MNSRMLHAIGSPSMERLGAAPHSKELRQIASNDTRPLGFGRLRISLVQCACLRLNRLSATHCVACGRGVVGKRPC